MIWATVSSWSCFCWLYRASPSLTVKNIINLITVVTIRWCPCVESSLRGCLLWPVHSLGKTLLTFALLHFVLQGQTCLLLQVFLDFLVLHSSPLWCNGHIFWVLILEGLVGLHAAAAAKLLQSCPNLHDPMDCSPLGSSVHGIFQARVLEWGAIAFSDTF